jgi:hypothetical protein
MKLNLLSTAVFVLGGVAVYGNTITLTQVNGNLYQQSIQSPCIFENPSCQQGGFTGTPLPTGGAVSGYNEFSPIYSGGTLLAIIGAGNPLLLGVDINQASGQPAQTLSGFEMLKNGIVVDTFSFAGSGNVSASNNGNGYADYLLANFSSFGAADQIQFHFVFNNANDGTENVFVIGSAGNSPVPEPSSWLLISVGLIGAGLIQKKRS